MEQKTATASRPRLGHSLKAEQGVSVSMEHSNSLEPDKENRHVCSECGKEYKQSSSLQRHINKVHSGENTKSHQCTHCPAKFHSKYQLTVHNRTHTNERPYACNLCSMRFRQNSHLLTHIRTHTKEKPYSCDDCGKKFTQSSSLKTHQRIHQNIKPFACPYCLKQFSQKHSRDRHVNNKKGGCRGEAPFNQKQLHRAAEDQDQKLKLTPTQKREAKSEKKPAIHANSNSNSDTESTVYGSADDDDDDIEDDQDSLLCADHNDGAIESAARHNVKEELGEANKSVHQAHEQMLESLLDADAIATADRFYVPPAYKACAADSVGSASHDSQSHSHLDALFGDFAFLNDLHFSIKQQTTLAPPPPPPQPQPPPTPMPRKHDASSLLTQLSSRSKRDNIDLTSDFPPFASEHALPSILDDGGDDDELRILGATLARSANNAPGHGPTAQQLHEAHSLFQSMTTEQWTCLMQTLLTTSAEYGHGHAAALSVADSMQACGSVVSDRVAPASLALPLIPMPELPPNSLPSLPSLSSLLPLPVLTTPAPPSKRAARLDEQRQQRTLHSNSNRAGNNINSRTSHSQCMVTPQTPHMNLYSVANVSALRSRTMRSRSTSRHHHFSYQTDSALYSASEVCSPLKQHQQQQLSSLVSVIDVIQPNDSILRRTHSASLPPLERAHEHSDVDDDCISVINLIGADDSDEILDLDAHTQSQETTSNEMDEIPLMDLVRALSIKSFALRYERFINALKTDKQSTTESVSQDKDRQFPRDESAQDHHHSHHNHHGNYSGYSMTNMHGYRHNYSRGPGPGNQTTRGAFDAPYIGSIGNGLCYYDLDACIESGDGGLQQIMTTTMTGSAVGVQLQRPLADISHIKNRIAMELEDDMMDIDDECSDYAVSTQPFDSMSPLERTPSPSYSWRALDGGEQRNEKSVVEISYHKKDGDDMEEEEDDQDDDVEDEDEDDDLNQFVGNLGKRRFSNF